MPGVRHKVYVDGRRRLRLVEYSRSMQPHGCEKGHWGYVIEGRLELQFDGETVTLVAGDGVCIPEGPAFRHVGRALTDKITVVFVEEVRD
jgi:quercetin dioxygenase-like cupin family protein